MKLAALMRGAGLAPLGHSQGDDVTVTGFAIDHRKIAPGTVFGAFQGERFNAEDFIPAAIEAGAVAIVARPEARVEGAAHIASEEPRRAFAQLAAGFFTPAPETIVAVTGTNGKTSCAEMTRQIWRMCGERAASIGTLGVTTPDGSPAQVTLEPAGPGRFEGSYEGPEMGRYRLENGDQTSVIGLGPAAPREFVETIASGDALAPITTALRGGTFRVEDGLPRLRNVRAGRPAAGRGWLGLTPREAYETRDVRQTAILPPWLVLLLSALLITAAWLREGRR